MPGSALVVGRRLVVWMTALAATLEIVGQAAIAIQERRAFEVGVWMAVGLAVILASLTIDKLKAFVQG